MVNREPATIDRNTAQWGFEARTPSHAGDPPCLVRCSSIRCLTPVLTADFKSDRGAGLAHQHQCA